MDKPWFPKKKIGYGWGLPIRWQGWLVLIIYIGLSYIGARFLTDPIGKIPYFILYFSVLTFIFVFICWKKGEKNDL